MEAASNGTAPAAPPPSREISSAEWLAQSGIEEAITEALPRILKEQPDDPVIALAKHLIAIQPAVPHTLQTHDGRD